MGHSSDLGLLKCTVCCYMGHSSVTSPAVALVALLGSVWALKGARRGRPRWKERESESQRLYTMGWCMSQCQLTITRRRVLFVFDKVCMLAARLGKERQRGLLQRTRLQRWACCGTGRLGPSSNARLVQPHAPLATTQPHGQPSASCWHQLVLFVVLCALLLAALCKPLPYLPRRPSSLVPHLCIHRFRCAVPALCHLVPGGMCIMHRAVHSVNSKR